LIGGPVKAPRTPAAETLPTVPRTFLIPLVLLALSGCSYGPVTDRSGVRSAALLPNDQIGVAYQVLRYRPARGIAAFPDGGVPRYLDDRTLIAVLPASGRARILQRLENGGVDGASSVGLRVAEADPGHLLVMYGEQASTSRASEMRMWRLDTANGRRRDLPDVAHDLESRDRKLGSRAFGDVRVIAEDGTLLIGAEGPQGAELWLWRPAEGYRRLDALKHFYGVAGGELYYWSGDEARVRDWRTGAYRVIARYDPELRQTFILRRDDPAVRAIEAAPPPGRQVAWRDKTIIVTEPDGGERTLPVDLGQ
jgi:hypothetical protein